ncbi:MAG: GtrA family protein, partial [Acidimicrobiia bacterium]|nr:GtrA family protein [Acidimicrobiia bacterium]
VLEGMDAADGEALAVLDADLQHDEAALPTIVDAVLGGRAEVCLGSRRAPGGSYGDFGPIRRVMSFVGAQLARGALGVRVSDPMSGYFAVSRARYEAVRPAINPRGFKILLDLLANGPRPRVTEVGYRFRSRRRGETKLTGRVVVAYLLAVLELAVGRWHTRRFVDYIVVAVAALSVRVSLWSLLTGLGRGGALQVAALGVALLGEYWGHHLITFRRDRSAPFSGLGRLARFQLAALTPVLAQLGVASLVEDVFAVPASGVGLLAMFALATGGVVVTLATGYHLSRTLVWPVSSAEG